MIDKIQNNWEAVCIVSPELHGRPYIDCWSILKQIKNKKRIMICTDFPDRAEEFLMDKVIKAVIFDMDGVLIDAKEWHYEALNKSLNIFGYSISRYDHLVLYDGLPTKQKLEMLSKERGLPKKLHSFINTVKQKYTMELVHSHCKPIFQHEYALSKLKSNGYKIACASNSIRNSIDIMLKKVIYMITWISSIVLKML